MLASVYIVVQPLIERFSVPQRVRCLLQVDFLSIICCHLLFTFVQQLADLVNIWSQLSTNNVSPNTMTKICDPTSYVNSFFLNSHDIVYKGIKSLVFNLLQGDMRWKMLYQFLFCQLIDVWNSRYYKKQGFKTHVDQQLWLPAKITTMNK